MTLSQQDLQLLARLNPEPDLAGSEAVDDRAMVDLKAIMACQSRGRAERRHRSKRMTRWALIPVTAGLVLVGLSTMPSSSPVGGTATATAATPPLLAFQPVPGSPTARQALEDIASSLSERVDDSGEGAYAYVRTRGWSLFTTVDSAGSRSEIVPQENERWLRADGSGRIKSKLVERKKPTNMQDRRVGPGGVGFTWPLRSLSPEPATLARQLERAHSPQNGPYERLVAISDLYRQMPTSTAVRAAVLRYLADTKDLELTGRVTDRAGRPGLAVSVETDAGGLPTRHTLIFDEQTGRLLANEEVLTERAGKLGVRIPAVISYDLILASMFTESDEG